VTGRHRDEGCRCVRGPTPGYVGSHVRPTPAFAAAIRWFQDRGLARTRERMFVGRWGDFGPELYVVGKRVRRLDGPQEHHGPPSRDHPVPAAFARRILTEVMHCRPATPLVRTFAGAHLEPFPLDGFVLTRSDVEAWLDGGYLSR
jgi:hypothetical protein